MSANMPHPEQPPEDLSRASMPRQRELGEIVLNGSLEELPTLPDADDFAALEAVANGEDIRPEDAGRVHDIEAAHEQAIEEDEQRTLARQDQPEEEEPQPETQPLQASVAANSGAADAMRAAAAHQSARQQAHDAMRAAGGFGHISPTATVSKDPFSGTFTVADGDHIQIIRPRAIGDRYEVTDYRYNEEERTLRISIRGHSSLTRPTGKFAAETATDAPAGETGSAEQPEQSGELITLPPVVARRVGALQVARVPAHS